MRPLWTLGLVLMLAGCATMPYGRPQAAAEIKNAKGDTVGTASFLGDSSGVLIVAEVRGIPPGNHGFHLHAVGKCDPPEFTTAGGHFNPEGKKHGMKNLAGPHAGDLPNLEVASDGTGRLTFLTKLVSLAAGPTSLFGADGTAVVIHANADDGMTDPTGNSGGRIACGVIKKTP